jgi:hypothetical protein
MLASAGERREREGRDLGCVLGGAERTERGRKGEMRCTGERRKGKK